MLLNELMYGKVVSHPILSGECTVTLLMEGAVVRYCSANRHK